MLRRYLLAIVGGNPVWEFAQRPLYTIWRDETAGAVVFAAVHCTGGVMLIAGSALLGALLVASDGSWPHARFWPVASIAVIGGLAYTVFSEWLNTKPGIINTDQRSQFTNVAFTNTLKDAGIRISMAGQRVHRTALAQPQI